ncbi:hypothetical protein niasHS_002620 [Heterodera schachtii]|uniref:Sulfhydryl oxidase n=1 Tax=Heterodera schachtii TaxID=97005 RepID=A0ABD2KLY6_HETSC
MFFIGRKRRKWAKSASLGEADALRRGSVRRHFPVPLVRFALLFVGFVCTVSAPFADHGSVPRGTSPTLYDSEDLVVQLDDHSFNDTVFCSHADAAFPKEQKCTAMVVKFYSDWCGHCRTYARVYKALADDLRSWNGVLKLAAINCADPINSMTCRFSGITHYPYIKYFPRNSTSMDAAETGRLLRSHQSMAEMRDEITRALLDEWEKGRYADWPDFEPLGEVETHSELWEGVDAHIQTMVVIFEKSVDSLVGPQFLLDMQKHSDKIVARRCVENSLSTALQIIDFPTFAVFRRGERFPVFVADTNAPVAALPRTFSRRKGNGGGAAQRTESFCETNPEECKKLYFTSELDMLKSARMALFNDLQIVEGSHLSGSNLSALFNFVDLLAKHFPYSTEEGEEADGNRTERFLNASGRARVVFSHLRDFVESVGLDGSVALDDWKREFLRAEVDQGSPFPVTEEWEHCKGSSPILRGFTCGLWMVFHSLTVNAFRQNSDQQQQFHPVAVLLTIKDWVTHFFACEHCRAHFHRMTTKTAKIEAAVRQKEDVFLYLWKAHNLVNGRLRGRETEDPKFPKYQFPPKFLCPECRRGDKFDEGKVREFLLKYYGRVRPIDGEQRTTENGRGNEKHGGRGEEEEEEADRQQRNERMPKVIGGTAEEEK